MAKKIGECTVYSQNGTWAPEYGYIPTDEFASGKNFRDAKRELRRLVNTGEAKLVMTQSENSFHTSVYDIVITE